MVNILLSHSILNQPHVFEHAKKFIRSTDYVAILAFSFFDHQFLTEQDYHQFYEKNGEYYEKMMNIFDTYGIKENQVLWINYYKDTKTSAIEKIKKADIVYFPGGAPELMMKRILEFDIKEAIEAHQKVYVGSSAGAMIQFREYHMSPDYDYPHFSYEKGLNLCTGFFIEVHYRRRKKQKSALRKVHRAYHQPIYVIPDDGAIIVDQNEIFCIGSAYQYYDKKGIIRR